MSQALVVPKLAFDKLYQVQIQENVTAISNCLSLFDLPTYLQDRTTCETDEAYLQIIPYVIIKDTSGYILSYRRGKGSGEQRLLEKCSIGFGGHVEENTCDGLDRDRFTKMSSLLSINTLRELNEELNIPISYFNYNLLFNKFRHGDFSVIYSTKSEVEKYHLCLCLSITVTSQTNAEYLFEQQVIENSKWMSKEELLLAHKDNSRVLENWSEIALHHYI